MRIINVILLSLLPLLFACNKNKTITTKGKAEAEINGVKWASNYGILNINDSLITFHFTKGEFIRGDFSPNEYLRCFSAHQELGRQPLLDIPFHNLSSASIEGRGFALFNTYLQNGRKLCSQYMIHKEDSANNWIRIEREEGNFNKVWGSFSMTMITDTSWHWSGNCSRNPYTDTIRITNGTFYAERE